MIIKYFLNFVCKTNRSARVARPGRGVKNCIIAGMQKYFDRGGFLVVGTKKS